MLIESALRFLDRQACVERSSRVRLLSCYGAALELAARTLGASTGAGSRYLRVAIYFGEELGEKRAELDREAGRLSQERENLRREKLNLADTVAREMGKTFETVVRDLLSTPAK